MKFLSIIIALFFFTEFKSQTLDLNMLRAINKNEHRNLDISMRITSHSVYPVMVLAPSSLLLSGYLKF